jgi:molecular chaperone GrpE (heat shock protein)
MMYIISELVDRLRGEEEGFDYYFVDAEEYRQPGDRDPETGHKQIFSPILQKSIDTRDAVDEFLGYKEVHQKYRLDLLSLSGLEAVAKKLYDLLGENEWYRVEDLENFQDVPDPEDYQYLSKNEDSQDDQLNIDDLGV